MSKTHFVRKQVFSKLLIGMTVIILCAFIPFMSQTASAKPSISDKKVYLKVGMTKKLSVKNCTAVAFQNVKSIDYDYEYDACTLDEWVEAVVDSEDDDDYYDDDDDDDYYY